MKWVRIRALVSSRLGTEAVLAASGAASRATTWAPDVTITSSPQAARRRYTEGRLFSTRTEASMARLIETACHIAVAKSRVGRKRDEATAAACRIHCLSRRMFRHGMEGRNWRMAQTAAGGADGATPGACPCADLAEHGVRGRAGGSELVEGASQPHDASRYFYPVSYVLVQTMLESSKGKVWLWYDDADRWERVNQ